MTGTSEPDGLYELLEVGRDASAAEITRAYHRRARALHPDAQPDRAGEAARFRELREAYRVLHDPARRAAYDQALRPPTPAPAAPGPAAPGPAAPGPAAPEPPLAWPEPPSWPAARPPGATVWAGPVQVIPPDADPAATQVLRAWLAALAAADRGDTPGLGWPW